MRILVTGGTGRLGRAIAAQTGQPTLRVMSRQPVTTIDHHAEYVQADIASGEGLHAALENVDAIIHCASSPAQNTYEVDVAGTKRLLETARQQGVQHVIYVSIIGIDRIPYAYYQYKLGAELEVIELKIPYSIVRIAQFHDFVDERLQRVPADDFPMRLVADMQFQTIDVRDAARYLIMQAESKADNQRVDLGGPVISTLGKMAQTWLEIRGMQRPIADVPAAQSQMPLPEGFRHGYNTAPASAYGSITWEDYLK